MIKAKHIIGAALLLAPTMIVMNWLQLLGLSEWTAGWVAFFVLIATVLGCEKVADWRRRAQSNT